MTTPILGIIGKSKGATSIYRNSAENVIRSDTKSLERNASSLAPLTYYVHRSSTDTSKGTLSGVTTRTNDLPTCAVKNTKPPKLNTTSTALSTTEIPVKKPEDAKDSLEKAAKEVAPGL